MVTPLLPFEHVQAVERGLRGDLRDFRDLLLHLLVERGAIRGAVRAVGRFDRQGADALQVVDDASSSAPPAVCASDTASFALWTAWLVPLICVVNCWLIARPAASSAALLMRKPEDRRCKDCRQRRLAKPVRLFCAFSESILVLSVSDIVKAPES